MPRDKVASEFVARAKRSFEVDAAAWGPVSERRLAQRLVRDIELKLRSARDRLYARNGQTAAIARDRSAKRDRVGIPWTGDAKASVFRGEHLALRLNKSCKHELAPRN